MSETTSTMTSDTSGAAITFKHVSKSFGDNEIIKDLNFEIQPGEFVTILGSSGSGKTTTLKMVNRLEAPTSGDIIINGCLIKTWILSIYAAVLAT